MDELLLDELKSRYEREWDRKGVLDDKANNVISIAGIITGLIFGFVTFSTSIFNFSFSIYLSLIIILSIVASILAILVAVLVLRLKTYRSTFSPKNLRDDQNKALLINSSDEDLRELMINSYINCILHNTSVNDDKAKKLNFSNISLFTSILLIGIATAITLLLFQNITSATFVIPEGASIQGNPSYNPNPITVMNNKIITVENTDSLIHTVTSGNGPNDNESGKHFDTGIVKPAETVELVIANPEAGEYSFYCTIHPYMKGTIKLIDSG